MRVFRFLAVMNFCAVFFSTSPMACTVQRPFNLQDVRNAKVVVVGRIAHFRVIPDVNAIKRQREIAARFPALAKLSSNTSGFVSDHARLDILVDEILKGSAPPVLKVRWDGDRFSSDKTMPIGPFLIALTPAGGLPIDGPIDKVITPLKGPKLAVMQQTCAGSFLFESTGKPAAEIRQILAEDPE